MSQELARQDAERAAKKLARIEEEKRLKREAREEEERASEKRRLKAAAGQGAPRRGPGRANDRGAGFLPEPRHAREEAGQLRRARLRWEACRGHRGTAEAARPPTRGSKRDYEGSHDIRTRKPVNYDDAAWTGTRRGHRGRDGTPRVRDLDASKDASEESAGAGGEEDDGLGTDSSEDEETCWQVGNGIGRRRREALAVKPASNRVASAEPDKAERNKGG